ncbi:putative nucleolar protein 16 [Cocos nucifera]|nr:putative nucleolar protein 16 [Cocos nucifera]
MFKPTIDIASALATIREKRKWDIKGTVIHNYYSFDIVVNPNVLNVCAHIAHIV